MPSRVTAVPGSHGPRHSGSVMVDALQVPTQASALVVVQDPPSLTVPAAAVVGGLVGSWWPFTSTAVAAAAVGGVVTDNKVTLRPVVTAGFVSAYKSTTKPISLNILRDKSVGRTTRRKKMELLADFNE